MAGSRVVPPDLPLTMCMEEPWEVVADVGSACWMHTDSGTGEGGAGEADGEKGPPGPGTRRVWCR